MNDKSTFGFAFLKPRQLSVNIWWLRNFAAGDAVLENVSTDTDFTVRTLRVVIRATMVSLKKFPVDSF
jgi:hypothetical protein